MATQNPYVPAGASAVLEDTVLEARMPWSGRIARGEHLVLVDLEGQQAINFLCFDADDPEERYHAPNTIKLQGNIYLGRGSVLWSVRARKMMTVVEDTCGGHVTIFGCCSFELDDVRYGRPQPPGVPAELRVRARPPRARAGRRRPEHRLLHAGAGRPRRERRDRRRVVQARDHVDLRAEMDVLVVISNCPEALNPATGDVGPTPIRAIRYRP